MSCRSVFEEIRKIKLAAESERICDGSDGQIGRGQKLRRGFRFFLKDELTGRNAHAGLEQPRKVADMISGSLCHLLYRDLLVQMGFHVGNRIGKGRVKGLGNKGNAVFWTAVQIIAEQIQNSLLGFHRRKDIILPDAVDEIEEKLFSLFRVFRVDAERQMNEFKQVGLLAGDLEMAIVGAVWIMDIGKNAWFV